MQEKITSPTAALKRNKAIKMDIFMNKAKNLGFF